MIDNKYDIIIVGGGTSGVSCAYNSAKLGLKTLLIEQNSFLGGSITSSLVVPAMKTSDNSINNVFFNELYLQLKKVNGAITYCDGNKGWFNPELTKIILDKMLLAAGVDILFESKISKINYNNNKILSLCIEEIYDNNNLSSESKILLNPIETKYVVDATGDAKICEMLNCKFLENKSTQPASLRFIMSGVNVKEFSEWIMSFDKNRDVTTSCIIDNNIYLSTAYTWDDNIKWALKPLFQEAIQSKDLEKEDSNYFQIFSIAGTPDSIGFNAPRLLNQKLSRSEQYIKGREAILRLANFCKKYLKGFENAYISSIANTLGVRVSRRVECKYIYTSDDLKSGKTFDTPVVISNYPIDIHSDKKNNSKLEVLNKEYQLPIESLMVKNFNNLFVTGRCISADFEAQAALRIIPSCFSMGEGVAKYIAKNI